MITWWEVVAVLVPLCAVSAYTGYAYARRVAAIEQDADAPAAPVADASAAAVPPGASATAGPESVVPAPAVPLVTRFARPARPDDAIDLAERLGPFGAARHKPAS